MAAPDELNCGQWNMGLANEHFASAGDRIHIEVMPAAAFNVNVMCQYVHFVVINEVHPWLRPLFCQELDLYPNLKKCGWDTGDVVVWRRSM